MKKTKKITITDYHPKAKPFQIEQIIKQQVERESDYFWAMNTEEPSLPLYQEVRIRKSIGAWNIARNIIRNMRP